MATTVRVLLLSAIAVTALHAIRGGSAVTRVTAGGVRWTSQVVIFAVT